MLLKSCVFTTRLVVDVNVTLLCHRDKTDFWESTTIFMTVSLHFLLFKYE